MKLSHDHPVGVPLAAPASYQTGQGRMSSFASLARGLGALLCCGALSVPAQFPGGGPRDGGPDFGGPPFGGGGPGGFSGMGQQKTKLVKQFDKDGDNRLNREERQAARESLSQRGGNRRFGGPGGRRGGFGGRGESQEPAQPGPRVAPADVKAYPDAPLYASNVLRAMFLEFEQADWEKELEDFHHTDVEVPAKLIVDGRTYPDVGVRFRGASSFMMVGSGRKRSLNLSLDFVHQQQNLGGYRTLNLLNSHGDPTFMRAVLYYDIAREYLPAPKANWVNLVINGESWGVYVSLQQFNKDFIHDWFGTRKGARWKVPGSPRGQGSLAYLGDNAAAYKRIYEIKSKDDPQSWAALIRLCKVLNQTPAADLEAALAPLLDVDGALKFLALENVLVNNDGYWTRASDYHLYLDEQGRFHIIPYDANETFSSGGGPGPGGGFGPGGGPGFGGGPGGPPGPDAAGPGMFLAPSILAQADKNEDGRVDQREFTALADGWFDTLDANKTGMLTRSQFVERLPNVLPPPPGAPGFGPPGADPADRPPRGGGPAGFGPGLPEAHALFTALDANKDGSLTRADLKDTFTRWLAAWDTRKSGALDEDALRRGLASVLPRLELPSAEPSFGGRGGQRGPEGGGFGGGMRGGGVNLDPLVAAHDQSKPLLSKLLAVPALRARYLGYVRDLAEKELDWKKLGPRVAQYRNLLAGPLKADTRKLSTYEAFLAGTADDSPPTTVRGTSLQSFAERRRAYLLNHAEIKKLAR
jgi:spore coat protein CotH